MAVRAETDITLTRVDDGTGSAIWTTSTAPTTPNYTFTISNLSGPTGTPAVGDLIVYSYYRYTITSVSTTTVQAGSRTSIRGASGASSKWYTGTGITGTSTTPTIYSGSGVSSAVVGDMYLNTDTGNTYRCTTAGAATAAKWVYSSNIQGDDGVTFTPSVDAAGDISWTNDGGLPNPPTQNIMGPAGSAGVSVTSVKTQYYLSTSDSSATGGSWSDTPQTFVSGKYYWTRDYINYSDGTHDTSTAVYNRGLTYACEYAESASDAADQASEYAARALGNLSTVQSVAETLTWITQHGTMALTTDVALDPTHVYFVVDAGGDYTVGGVTYAIVTEPDVADIGTYYELTIDESLNNYVGTHLALDSEGLWLLPASSGTDKVLIATGAGSTYTVAGTYIVDSSGATVASFRADGETIGISDGTESYLALDYHSMQMIDAEGNAYFYVSDLRDTDGNITETFTGDGSTHWFGLIATPQTVVSVKINGTAVTPDQVVGSAIYFSTAPANGATIVVKYLPQSADREFVKAFTLGKRLGRLGAMSVAEGYEVTASGNNSHAEGEYTEASGDYSHAEGQSTKATGSTCHAEGLYTEANGNYSHARNQFTKAERRSQSVMGEYNVLDTGGGSIAQRGNYAVIIGNGTANSARSDALEVDWSGDVFLALDTNAGSGTDHDLYAAITALGWGSDVIV